MGFDVFVVSEDTGHVAELTLMYRRSIIQYVSHINDESAHFRSVGSTDYPLGTECPHQSIRTKVIILLLYESKFSHSQGISRP